ncbi:lysM and putative peptidoglycan-binding domain-containing protein 3 [Denticeps clupeoides]|uniref:LysM and putative peptidoglycan-binding domain-containing protein 3 n=1 Tax=Denticeps clupeoides TaxID=299321 RepID=A0AAY4BTA8_9TELE|nr:lysM and putative peptidoglycan-binding domain-containing protein 3 [Denticeps clupeoides]
MTGKTQHNGFQSATTVQPLVGGHAYVFGTGSETECSEEDGESYELRSRGRVRRSTSRDRVDDIVYLLKDIQEGDTLNSLSLQFFCPVADIKRANNLLTEQDFFALRSIKIPVKRFSVLTETHGTAPLKSGSPGSIRRLPDVPQCTAAAADSSASSTSSTDSIGSFLQEKDKDIEQLVKSTGSSRNSLNEVVSSLSPQQQPLLGDSERRAPPRKDPYYGADWGMRWWTAVAIMLVVGIVTPVFYLLYYEVLVKTDAGHHDGTKVQKVGAELTDPTLKTAVPVAADRGGGAQRGLGAGLSRSPW